MEFDIQQITHEYDPKEDRIRLITFDREGERRDFWLTQRLCNLLVRSLIERLDSSVKTMVGTGATDSRSIHMWEQAAAQEEAVRRSRETVESRAKKEEESMPSAAPILLTSVGIGYPGNGCVLRFQWEENSQARLMLRTSELRQWLNIVHRQYRIAGWPTRVWPEWIRETKSKESRPVSRLLH